MNRNLELVLDYYLARRQCGHTTAILEGARNTKGCMLMVCNNNHKRYIEGVDSKSLLTPNEAYKLRGCRKPLLIDHAALHVLVTEYMRERNEREMNKRLEDIDLIAKHYRNGQEFLQNMREKIRGEYA